MKMRGLILMMLGFAVCGGTLRAAEDQALVGNLAFPLSQEGSTARAVGMGSAYVGVAEGASSLLWNPAGLASLQASELAVHHKTSLADAIQEIVVFGLPLGGSQGLGLAFNYGDNGSFEGRDAAGNPTGNYTARSYGANLGWGFGHREGISMGLAAKVNQASLADTSYTSVAGDAGLLWNPCSAFSLGAAYTNFGPDVAGRPLASGLRLGLASYVGKGLDYQWLFAASGESQTNGANSLHFGAESTLYQFLALRAGYAFDIPMATAPGLTGWTFGAGFMAGDFNLDYAYVPLTDVGNVQRVSVSYRFMGENRPLSGTAETWRAYDSPSGLDPAEKVLVLTDQSFDSGSTSTEVLSTQGRQALDAYLLEWKQAQGMTLRIDGRSSVVGGSEALSDLGQKRSDLVKAYLFEKDVPAARITSLSPPHTSVAGDAGIAKSIYLIVVR